MGTFCHWVGLGTLAALVLGTTRALACEPEPGPYWTVASTLPEDGEEGVPLNSGIVVDGTPWRREGESFWMDPFVVEELSSAGVDAGVSRVVPGDFLPWYGDPAGLVWVPAEPFRPFTRYRVEGQITHGGWAMAPDEVEGTDVVAMTFTTGDTTYEPLALDGELEVRLEAYDEDVQDGCCVAPCPVTGTRRALRASVNVPKVNGGDSKRDYRLWLLVTEGEPAQIDGPASLVEERGEVSLSQLTSTPAGVVAVLSQEVPEIGRAYRPCFAIAVWDTGGRWISDSLCLEELSPAEWLVAHDGDEPPVLPDVGEAPDAAGPVEVPDQAEAAVPQAPTGEADDPLDEPTTEDSERDAGPERPRDTTKPTNMDVGRSAIAADDSEGCSIGGQHSARFGAVLALGILLSWRRRRAQSVPSLCR